MYGIILGLLSSAAFGLIPLFTIPLTAAGVSTETALVYRFGIATIAMGLILLQKRETVRVALKDFFKLAVLSFFYLFAVVAYFHSFRLLPSSVAATIQFLYPLIVMLIMISFFHEKFSWRIGMAVILGIGGVAMLSASSGENSAILLDADLQNTFFAHNPVFWGVTLSLLSGLGNSLYMVGIQVAKIPHINGVLMTFYVMLFGTGYALANALACGSLAWISGWREIGLAVMLALVTAVFSNLTLIMAIKKIGSTLAAILGVMEPVTAVLVGIAVFGEPFTTWLAAGVIFIIASVLIAIWKPKKTRLAHRAI